MRCDASGTLPNCKKFKKNQISFNISCQCHLSNDDFFIKSSNRAEKNTIKNHFAVARAIVFIFLDRKNVFSVIWSPYSVEFIWKIECGVSSFKIVFIFHI